MRKGDFSKSHLFLMEFICVVLFFAVCAAVCVQAFVKSDALSRYGQTTNEALLAVQSAAETIKAMKKPDFEKAKALETGTETFSIIIEPETEGEIFSAVIKATDKNEKQICCITVKKYVPGGDWT
ncbi:MAG: hypothetical protein ACI4LO_09900 [Anaerovoracaceae bacterium]